MGDQPIQKNNKLLFGTQVFLRILCTVATLIASLLMLTNKQTVVVYGLTVDARYSYSSAFKFFAYANIVACGCSVLFLIAALTLNRNLRTNFCIFIHDLVMSTLLMAGCAAATAIGFVGKYGNSHIGWVAICDHFAKFCDKVTYAVMSSYISAFLYLILTIISANRLRNMQD